MTVADLREMIKDLPDDMRVVIPWEPSEGFTGAFYTPCTEESTDIGLGIDEGTSEVEQSFALVPCGFFEKEHDPIVQLN